MQKSAKNDKKQVLAALLKEAAFSGFNQQTLEKVEGLTAFPKGISEAVDFFAQEMDATMATHCDTEAFKRLKIREKIKEGLMFRFRSHQKQRETIRRLMSYYALPAHAAEAASHVWRTADRLWYLAGDTATDYNYYTKRTLLSGVYSSTLLAWTTDSTHDLSLTEEFLDRRIADVMKIETAKRSVKEFFGKLGLG